MMGAINFDASEVEPEFQPMPPGWYHMTVVGSEMQVGKKPDAGEILKLTLEIDGDHHAEYVGRRVFHNMCINHKKDQVRHIAQRHLGSICYAINEVELKDSDDLLGLKLMVKLRIGQARYGYQAQNEAAAYAPEGEIKKGFPPRWTAADKERANADRLKVRPEAHPDIDRSISQVGPHTRVWKGPSV